MEYCKVPYWGMVFKELQTGSAKTGRSPSMSRNGNEGRPIGLRIHSCLGPALHLDGEEPLLALTQLLPPCLFHLPP